MLVWQPSYTTKELAEMLEVSPWTIRKYIREGRLNGKIICNRWGYSISPASLGEFLIRETCTWKRTEETEPELAKLGFVREYKGRRIKLN